MSDYTPEVGHRVKVTREWVGDVEEITPDNGFYVKTSEGGRSWFPAEWCRSRGDVRTVERLADPEPKWQPGQLVAAADGKTYGFIGGHYPWALIRFLGASVSPAWTASNGIADADVPRPITPLTDGAA